MTKMTSSNHSYEFWNFHESTASYFDKIGGILPNELEEELVILSNIKINGWPIKSLFKKLNLQTQKEFNSHMNKYKFNFMTKSTDGISISHEEYSKIKGSLDQSKFSSILIDSLKDYFMQEKLKIILKEESDPILSLAYREKPKNVFKIGDDILKDEDIIYRGDILFTIKSSTNPLHSVKIPSFFSRNIINQFNLGSIPVKIIKRKNVVSRNSNLNAITNRMIVTKKYESEFLDIFSNSCKNLMYSINDIEKLDQLKKDQKEYAKIKLNPKWAKES